MSTVNIFVCRDSHEYNLTENGNNNEIDELFIIIILIKDEIVSLKNEKLT